MLNVTLNETEIINNALKGEYDRENIIVVLRLLMKYYYLQGTIDKLELKEKLFTFLKDNYKDFKRPKWDESITKMIHGFLVLVKKKKIDIVITDVKEIHITKSELGSIQALNDIKLEKIAFIMLVYAKISNIITNNKSDGWINQSCSTICKEARVNLKGIEKIKIFNNLYEKEYIKQRKNNAKTNMKVNYIDNDSEVEMTINDFDGVIYQYLIWKGERWKKCNLCEKWIKQKSKKPTLYCNSCKKEKQLEWQKKSMKKIRNC